MANQAPLSIPAQISIGALMVLGMLGGSMIVAYSGFMTSPRRGGASTFVPIPEAYVVAGFLYLMSVLAMTVLLRYRKTSLRAIAAAIGIYIVAAALLAVLLAPDLQ